MVEHACKTSTWEALAQEAGLLQVSSHTGQQSKCVAKPRLPNETLSPKEKKKQ